MAKKFYIYLFTGVLLLQLLPAVYGNNKALIAAKVKELAELNRLVLNSIKNPKYFNGKQIFVKVKILPGTGEKIKFKIEKISVDKIKPSAQDDSNTIYLKGKVKNSGSNNYNVNLSHILPKKASTITAKTAKTVITDKTTRKNKNEKTKVNN